MSKTTTALAQTSGVQSLIQYEDPETALAFADFMAEEKALMARDFRPPLYHVAPGGATQWIDKKAEKPVTDDVGRPLVALTGIILGEGVAGTLYTEKFGEGDDKFPFCVTTDYVTGRVNLEATDQTWKAAARVYESQLARPHAHPAAAAYVNQQPIPIEHSCATCACNQWRSARYYGGAADGNGKACQESRLLAVLFPGYAAPVIVRISKGSLENWVTYKSRLALKGIPYFAVHTELGLVTTKNAGGIKFTQIVFEQAGRLSKEQIAEAAGLRSRYRGMVAQETIQRDMDYYANDAVASAQDGEYADVAPTADDDQAPPF